MDKISKLGNYLVNSGDILEFTGSSHCRCGLCMVFALSHHSTKVRTFEADSLEELIDLLPDEDNL